MNFRRINNIVIGCNIFVIFERGSSATMNKEEWGRRWQAIDQRLRRSVNLFIDQYIWGKLYNNTYKKVLSAGQRIARRCCTWCSKAQEQVALQWCNALRRYKDIARGGECFWRRRYRSNLYKRLIAVGVLAFLSYGSIFIAERVEAYRIANTPIAAVEVFFKGQKIGIVASKEPLQQAIDEMEKQIEAYYNMDAIAEGDIAFSPVAVKPSMIQDDSAVIAAIKKDMHFKVRATALVVNGKQIAILKDADAAQSILDKIKQPYVDKAKGDPNIREIRIADDVQLVDKLVEYSQVEDVDDVYNRIMAGTEGQKIYEVKAGDTIWAIAKRYQLSIDDIKKANPDMASLDDLQIGDKINLTVPEKIINVETVERVEYTEAIPYQTVYKQDSSLYKNQSKVVKEGSEGQRKVTADVIKRNGIEEKRVIVAETVVKQASDQVIAKGTKPLPSLIGTGNIGLPARGRITSRFGYRGREFHTGVDIAAPYGSPIYAADNGKVIWAGWDGNYGRLVKIDHGNGMVTYYAHISRIVVKVGQRVAKGQLIAYVGTSGRSTGPHVHFEVRKNGKPINPLR